MTILTSLSSPSAIKNLTHDQKLDLCAEIREEILTTVSKNGGHLASNLGAVELTAAIYSTFDMESDRLIFDVGHQCYAHKILSGRLSKFSSLRQRGGISGFPKRCESSYDPFGAGHSGTAISAAVGFAEADRLSGNDNWTVAVVGDGSFTNGMIYEALNNSKNRDLRLIIILNDNEMSIGRNVGALSRYFRNLRSSQKYFSLKHGIKRFFAAIPLLGKPLTRAAGWVKDKLKGLVLKTNIFEDLGLEYLGPLDGNDLNKVEAALTEAKTKRSTTVIHLCTKKGKGYAPAEERPDKYHAVPPFNLEKGVQSAQKETYSTRFGQAVKEAAERDENIVAISAAMTESTGLAPFKKAFPERFFDVGIAEEHALTFAAGLSAAGKKPIYAVYSTFAQRCYDQVFHDASIQSIPLVLGLDRAGIVSGDGQTHQGIFDMALFSQIPNTEIYSPDTFEEMEASIKASLESEKISVIRYPKGSPAEYDREGFTPCGKYLYKDFGENPKTLIVTFGRLTQEAVKAAEILQNQGVAVRVIKLIKVYPLSKKALTAAAQFDTVLIAEEGIKQGGIAQAYAAALAENGYKGRTLIAAIEGFVPSLGSTRELMQDCGLTAEKMVEKVVGNRE